MIDLATATEYLPMALIMIALAVIMWANVLQVRTADQVKRWKNDPARRTTDRLNLNEISRQIDDLLTRIAEAPSENTLSVAPNDPGPRIEKTEPLRADPLRGEKAQVEKWLVPVLEGLEKWSAAGYIDFYGIAPAARQLYEINRQIADAKQAREIQALEVEIVRMLPDLLCIAIAKTDISLDPDRTNKPLQTALEYAVKSSGMMMIDPELNTVVDPAIHRTISVKPGSPAQRGRVAEVRRRGLRGRSGAVIQVAEVRESD